MPKNKGFLTSIHPASQNELDVLKTYQNKQSPTAGVSGSDTLRVDTPKYATMPFSGADVVSEWVTVAGALRRTIRGPRNQDSRR